MRDQTKNTLIMMEQKLDTLNLLDINHHML